MNTTTTETTMTHVEELIASLRKNADDHGTSVRCPVCGAGAGKFCRVDMRDTPKAKSSAVILHEARVTAARAAK